MRNGFGFRKLIAWQKANLLAHLIYDITGLFPKDELFGITNQMRRSALSVAANIAEGYSRKTIKDRRHFYQMAQASLTELEFFIDFSYERKFMSDENYKKVIEYQEECARVLNGLIKSS